MAVSLEIMDRHSAISQNTFGNFSLRTLCAFRIFALNPNPFQIRNQIQRHPNPTSRQQLQTLKSPVTIRSPFLSTDQNYSDRISDDVPLVVES
jgi:hypothetical protein